MGRFEYLPYLIPTLLAECIIISIVVLWPFLRRRRNGVLFNHEKPLLNISLLGSDAGQPESGDPQSTVLFLPSIPFESTYSSANKTLQLTLFITRVLSCLFFPAIGVGLNTELDSRKPFDLKFFTNWNVLLISLYFALATLSSILGARGDFIAQDRKRFSMFLHVLFEVAGSTAMMVTVVDFTLLESDFNLMNTTCHFATSCALIVESLLNSFDVRWPHLVFVFCWFMAYLSVIWPLVYYGKVTEWPYDFLDTSSSSSFAWYSALLFAVVIFYGLWVYIAKAKKALHCWITDRARRQADEAIEERNVAFLDAALTRSDQKVEMA